MKSTLIDGIAEGAIMGSGRINFLQRSIAGSTRGDSPADHPPSAPRIHRGDWRRLLIIILLLRAHPTTDARPRRRDARAHVGRLPDQHRTPISMTRRWRSLTEEKAGE